ncbi:MAG: hypothetical protein JW910_23590 [Anaerolineae bacterium]|nr:hypothetical protein [Anaerolineae bacterium]
MNILGIGPAELVIIIVVMLIFAGPKRMVQWAYVAGQYVAQLRQMWQETSAVIRKELEQAGLEPELIDSLQRDITNPRQLRSKVNPLDRVVGQMKQEVVKPVEDVLKDADIRKDIQPGKASAAASETPAPAASNGDTPPDSTADDTPADSPPEESSSGRYDAWTPN